MTACREPGYDTTTGPTVITTSAPAAENPAFITDHAAAPQQDEGSFEPLPVPKPFEFQIGEAQADGTPEPTAALAPVHAEPLSEAETQAILDRLPPMPEREHTHALPAPSHEGHSPPPDGSVLAPIFPPLSDGPPAPPVEMGALKLVRFSPQGEIPLAKHLVATFSHPMVAASSHADVASHNLPVRLDPEPPGRWRWIDTRTLLFKSDPRFPMATQYNAVVHAGTRSAMGGVLQEEFTWAFSTPPPQVEHFWPSDGPQDLEPVLFLRFDQKIDPGRVMARVRLTGGDRAWPLKHATQAEIDSNRVTRRLVEDAVAGRWLAIRPIARLPKDTQFTVTIGPGVPSAEGPERSTESQIFSFYTYPPCEVVRPDESVEMEYYPVLPWRIAFSNPLDEKAFDRKKQITVEPPVEGLRVRLNGNEVIVESRPKASTEYRVTLASGIRDVFGQTLDEAFSVVYKLSEPYPSITWQAHHFEVLDPTEPPVLPVYSIGLRAIRVSVFAVTPDDWVGFEASRFGNKDPYGRKVCEKVVELPDSRDEVIETLIDLSPMLNGSAGQFVVDVTPQMDGKWRYWFSDRTAWIQCSRIGLSAYTADDSLVVWATELESGKPLEGVAVHIHGASAEALTGADGIAILPREECESRLLVARKGEDVAILPGIHRWKSGPPRDRLVWYVVDDRKLYRPGETVHIKGWVRQIEGGPRGDVSTPEEIVRGLRFEVSSAASQQIADGEAVVDRFGGFHFDFALPEAVNLGAARIRLDAQTTVALRDSCHSHSFKIQEFRRPEFEVTVQSNEGPFFQHGQADVTAEAAYFTGGALAGADVEWRVDAIPGRFCPPSREQFTFGVSSGGSGRFTWDPGRRLYWAPPPWHGNGDLADAKSLHGDTGPDGRHRLQMDFRDGPPHPTVLRAEATITDLNRRTWSAETRLLVHAAELYVGIRSQRRFIEQGDSLLVETIVTDLDGHVVPGQTVELAAERLVWRKADGDWVRGVTERLVHSITSREEPVRHAFVPGTSGQWRVRATVQDDKGRRNRSELTRWVAGAANYLAFRRGDGLKLVAEQDEWGVGQTARVLLVAPFYPAEGQVSLWRDGLVDTWRLSLDQPTCTIEVPIESAQTPGLWLKVDLVGSTVRSRGVGAPNTTPARRPASAAGSLYLSVPPTHRSLEVMVSPQDSMVAPGDSTEIHLAVRDAQGHPVADAQLLLMIVDEATLALTAYELADPIRALYPKRTRRFRTAHLRELILQARPDRVPALGRPAFPCLRMGVGTRPLTGMDYAYCYNPEGLSEHAMLAQYDPTGFAEPSAMTEQTMGQPLRLRGDLNPLAHFAPHVLSDESGRATVRVRLPDNLTRYRVMAVAFDDGQRCGKGESVLTAHLPLMVRPSPPRFLTLGDSLELAVVVQNASEEDLQVDLAAQATGLTFSAGAGRRVHVPARKRVKVCFPFVTMRTSVTRIDVAALAGVWSDATAVSIPIRNPVPIETLATYGSVDQGVCAQPLRAPANALAEFGGLEVTTSSTALEALTDAVLYLFEYPYACAEQMASRILVAAAMTDVLTAFEAPGLPEVEKLAATVIRGIEELDERQNKDGGYSLWRFGEPSWPFLTVHVAHALVRAREEGFAVPSQHLNPTMQYLKQIEERIPSLYSEATRTSIIAYALYVRALSGDIDGKGAKHLIREVGGIEKLPLEALGWLMPVLTAEGDRRTLSRICRLLQNRAVESAGTAQFTTHYAEGAHLIFHAARRTDALLLSGLMDAQPDSDLIIKLVRGLLGHRKRGRWSSTQENVWVLLALKRYFLSYESQTPDFLARTWLGDHLVSEQHFEGRSAESHRMELPMRHLAEAGGTQSLVLSKEGPGRMYYRIGMRYALDDLTPPAADHGISVRRVYEAVDDSADVCLDADGIWHIRAGSRVRIKLSMVAPARRYHIALEDKLPAGLEPLNPELAGVAAIPPDQESAGRSGMAWDWWSRWYDHDNLRDDGAEVFCSLLREGAYDYSYVARAITAGRFIAPPPRAEEMYQPETFGRGHGEVVIVE